MLRLLAQVRQRQRKRPPQALRLQHNRLSALILDTRKAKTLPCCGSKLWLWIWSGRGGDGLRQAAQDIETGRKAVHLTDGTIGPWPIAVQGQAAAEYAKAYGSAPQTDLATGSRYLPPPGNPVQSPLGGSPARVGAQSQFAIDPQTAAVKTAIPPAPRGGGYIVPNVPAGSKITEDSPENKSLREEDGKFLGNQLEGIKSTDSSIVRSQALAQAFKTFESARWSIKCMPGKFWRLPLVSQE